MIRLWLLAFVALASALAGARGADALPPRPAEYVTDRAGVLSAKTVTDWNSRLKAYERETSNQVLVAVFPSVPEDYAIEDFTQRTAESWGAGQKETKNGVVLFVFTNDHKMRIEVGYGLEGAIPDATAKSIIENEIRPAFRSGDFDSGVSRGLEAILAAARGEYHGTGSTDSDSTDGGSYGALCFLIFVTGLVIFGWITRARQQGRTYRGKRDRRGSQSIWGWPPGGGFSGGSWSSDWSSGSSSSDSGGGGGFSGGGGSFGGGGASGSW